MKPTLRTRRARSDSPRGGIAGCLLLTVVSAATLGCNSLPSTRFVSGLSVEERALASRLPVFREKLPEGSYQVVRPVTGYSCQISHDDGYRVSEDNAIEELQRATFKAGANAVMEVTCKHMGRRQGSRGCFRSIVCQGIAIQKT